MIAILVLGWYFASFSQNTENIPQKIRDSTEIVFMFVLPPKTLYKPIEIPNAYYRKYNNQINGLDGEINSQDDSVILYKDLIGSENIIMPGTEKLDVNNVEMKPDSIKNKQLIQPIESNQSKYR